MNRALVTLISAALAAGVMLQAPQRVIAAVNNIYVGGNDDATAASSCADPDFSTDLSDEGDINSALDAALAEVDDDGDIVIICDGDYTYAADINQYDGDTAHDVITIRAAAGADVTLDGNEEFQIFSFDNVNSVSISGITFTNAQAHDGAAIEILDGSLYVSDSTFTYGDATDGSAIYALPGPVIVSNSLFEQNSSSSNGVIYVDEAASGEGVTVYDSYFNWNVSSGEGAAISVDGVTSEARVSVSNSQFFDNDGRYGAITIDSGTVELVDVVMEGNNNLGQFGGAVWAAEGFTATESEFVNNSGTGGGAIYSGGSATVIDCMFEANVATDDSGGAIFIDGEVTIERSTFIYNEAFESGGAVNVDPDDGGSVIIKNSTFDSNSGYRGGAIGVVNGIVLLQRNTIVNNSTDDDGAVLMVEDLDSLSALNNIFTKNHAGGDGGVFGFGSVSNLTIKQNRFKLNLADGFGGLLEYGLEDELEDTDLVRSFRNNYFHRNRSDANGDGYGAGNIIHMWYFFPGKSSVRELERTLTRTNRFAGARTGIVSQIVHLVD